MSVDISLKRLSNAPRGMFVEKNKHEMCSILQQRTSVGSDTTNVEYTDNQLPVGPRNLILEPIGQDQIFE